MTSWSLNLSHLERRLGGGDAFLAFGDLESERLADRIFRRESSTGDGERSIDRGIFDLKFNKKKYDWHCKENIGTDW